MFSPPLVTLLFLAPPDGLATAAVVATQTDTALQERMARVRDWSQALGVTVLDAAEVMRRLTNQPNPQLVDLETLKKRVQQARELELRFDRDGAIAARNDLLNTYDNAIAPDYFDLQLITGHVLHDAIGAALEIRQTKAAMDAARMAQRRFPNVATDGTNHGREIAAILYRATVDLKRAPTTEVTIVSTKPGRVMADGVELGTIETTTTVKLTRGTWVFWMLDAKGKSLPHFTTVGEQPVTVEIDFALESSMSWTPQGLTLTCDGIQCNEALRALAKRIGVTEAVGLRLDDNDARQPPIAMSVRADDGSVESQPVIALADLTPPQSYFVKAAMDAEAATPDRFSGWSVVPFGVAQLEQGRPYVGSAFLVAGAGLLTWGVVAVVRHNNYTGFDSSHESSLRTQQNVAFGLLVGVGVASVVEAIVWRYRHPTYPDSSAAPSTAAAPRPAPEPTTSADVQ